MAVTPISVSPSLASVLNAAGDRNDVDFDYLLKTAVRESSLDPTAKAATSSATGLFQFLDTTWLQVMKSEGPRLGYQQYADAITENADGEYVIKDPKLRAQVLKLREDPTIAADMAAAFTKSNGDYLKSKFGRMPSPGELYIAHFLGAQGAEKMFDAGLKNPDQIAAGLFPREAAANPTIFYDHGQPRTIRQVYKALVAQHEGPSSLHPGYAVQQMVTAQQTAAAQQAASAQQLTVPPVQLALPGAPATGLPPVPLAPQQAVSMTGPEPLSLTGQQPLALMGQQPVPLAPINRPAAARPTPHGYYVVERPVVGGPPPEPEGNSRPVPATVASAPEIPSRIGPGNMSFTSLFSTEPQGASASPVAAPEEGQGAFFAQLYGQQ